LIAGTELLLLKASIACIRGRPAVLIGHFAEMKRAAGIPDTVRSALEEMPEELLALIEGDVGNIRALAVSSATLARVVAMHAVVHHRNVMRRLRAAVAAWDPRHVLGPPALAAELRALPFSPQWYARHSTANDAPIAAMSAKLAETRDLSVSDALDAMVGGGGKDAPVAYDDLIVAVAYRASRFRADQDTDTAMTRHGTWMEHLVRLFFVAVLVGKLEFSRADALVLAGDNHYMLGNQRDLLCFAYWLRAFRFSTSPAGAASNAARNYISRVNYSIYDVHEVLGAVSAAEALAVIYRGSNFRLYMRGMMLNNTIAPGTRRIYDLIAQLHTKLGVALDEDEDE
jgi:hypothetical protein